MIYFVCPGAKEDAGRVVGAALGRSCGDNQVVRVSVARWRALLNKDQPMIAVVIDPLAAWSDIVIETHKKRNAKLLIFGSLPASVAHYFGVVTEPITQAMVRGADCESAPVGEARESALRVVYRRPVGNIDCPLPERAFLRYDFRDEWNNLGFGAIRMDESIWAWSSCVSARPQDVVADVMLEDSCISTYAAIWDAPLASTLWFNRSVGPVDSQEWRLVEGYLAHYRHTAIPCCPVLLEVPYGYGAAVTMRLDCDEDIESARPLWKAYTDMKIPFSLAIHTCLLEDVRHHRLMGEVIAGGGSILSHSASHASDWGGTYEAALGEATRSAEAIEAVTAIPVSYAVSPFHQTPAYARGALSDANYKGCIGGIISHSPDFLMARAGRPPGAPRGFIGHSQQCMLHGDCVPEGVDPLAGFKKAFEIARNGGAFFGYLDHPFSARYQYGWASEEQRIHAHVDFINYMKRNRAVLFASEGDALDFLGVRARVEIACAGDHWNIVAPAGREAKWAVAVEYKGAIHALAPGGLVL